MVLVLLVLLGDSLDVSVKKLSSFPAINKYVTLATYRPLASLATRAGAELVESCYHEYVSIPHAQIAKPSAARRFARWTMRRLAPPTFLHRTEGFAASSCWSLTGGLAAGFSVIIYTLIIDGTLLHASIPLTLAWSLVAVFGAMLFFWPFLASFYVYRVVFRRGLCATRVGGAVFGALWHGIAHYWFVEKVGGDPMGGVLICPLLIGGLWGSWLPAASASDPRF